MSNFENDLTQMETDFTRDFVTILTYADVPHYKDYRFVFPSFNPDTPCDVLDLSARAGNSLKRKGIHTFGQLLTAELHDIWGCGKKAIKEIRTKFISYIYAGYTDEQRKRFWKDTFEATAEKYSEIINIA